jgi:hypothetical protein
MGPRIQPPTPRSGARKTEAGRPLPGPLADLGTLPGAAL